MSIFSCGFSGVGEKIKENASFKYIYVYIYIYSQLQTSTYLNLIANAVSMVACKKD